jgi:hypothetical protein
MSNQIFSRLLIILILGITLSSFSQKPSGKNWDIEKIKGTRQLPYPSYSGRPFLTESWVIGKIELTNGVIIDSLKIKYSSFKDELIYHNDNIMTPIVIDKAVLKGFSFVADDGQIRTFRKQYYENFEKSDHFFEVLSLGEPDLLSFRKVYLNTTMPYKDGSGIVKNMAYENSYSYYFYSPQHGYIAIRPEMRIFLKKFDKDSQIRIKKLLRKNKIRVNNEENFIKAWKALEEEGFNMQFQSY